MSWVRFPSPAPIPRHAITTARAAAVSRAVVMAWRGIGAGDGNRTHDIQLGKLDCRGFDSHRPLQFLATPSRPREIPRQLALELGKVARDHGDVEASEDRLLGLAIEQETEGCLEAPLRRMLAGGEPRARLARHRDVV